MVQRVAISGVSVAKQQARGYDDQFWTVHFRSETHFSIWVWNTQGIYNININNDKNVDRFVSKLP